MWKNRQPSQRSSLQAWLLGVLYCLGRLYLLFGWLYLLGGIVSAPVYTSVVLVVALWMWVACRLV